MSPRIDGKSSASYDYNKYHKEASTKPKTEVPETDSKVSTKTESKASVEKSGSYSVDSGFNKSVSGTGPGGIKTDAYVEGPKFDASISGAASADKDGIHLDLDVAVDAQLGKAGASAEKTYTIEAYGEKFDITVDLEAMGKVGADGNLNLSLDIGPGGVSVSASAEGFAGAKASITGGVTLAHEGKTLLSGEATLSASAGVSGEAKAKAGIDGGKVSFEASASATAGVGFGAEVSGEIDTAATADAVAQVFAGALREGVEEVAETAAEFANAAGEFIGDRAEDLVNLAEDVGDFVVDGAGKIVDAGKTVVSTIGDGADTVKGWLGL